MGSEHYIDENTRQAGACIACGLLVNFGMAIVEAKYLEHPRHYKPKSKAVDSIDFAHSEDSV